MPRHSENTRRTIIDTAYGLFYRKGFSRVGMDEIAAQSALTKRTLYYHYRSKDELLAAVLDHYHDLAMARINRHAERYCGRVDEIIDAKFNDLVKWSKTPGWTGSGFTRMVMELADLPGHPARDIAKRHKTANQAWWEERYNESGIGSPQERAREMSILMEGAMALMLMSGDRSFAETAQKAAQTLLKASAPVAKRRVSPRRVGPSKSPRPR